MSSSIPSSPYPHSCVPDIYGPKTALIPEEAKVKGELWVSELGQSTKQGSFYSC